MLAPDRARRARGALVSGRLAQPGHRQPLEPVDLPAAWTGSPTVVLVGYKQKTQFDIDRWVMGLLQSGADARIVELPTMPGLVPSAISGWIDDGMRSGIPREDWSAVVTLYGSSAKPVAKWTGTENGRLARVIVLDGDGRVIWFDDAGYSAKKALAVAELVDFPLPAHGAMLSDVPYSRSARRRRAASPSSWRVRGTASGSSGSGI